MDGEDAEVTFNYGLEVLVSGLEATLDHD